MTDTTTDERAARLAEINRIEGNQANRLNDGYAMPGMLGHALYADIETLLGIVRRLEATDCIPKTEVIDLIRAVPNLVADVKRLEAQRARALELLTTGYYGKAIRALEGEEE